MMNKHPLMDPEHFHIFSRGEDIKENIMIQAVKRLKPTSKCIPHICWLVLNWHCELFSEFEWVLTENIIFDELYRHRGFLKNIYLWNLRIPWHSDKSEQFVYNQMRKTSNWPTLPFAVMLIIFGSNWRHFPKFRIFVTRNSLKEAESGWKMGLEKWNWKGEGSEGNR